MKKTWISDIQSSYNERCIIKSKFTVVEIEFLYKLRLRETRDPSVYVRRFSERTCNFHTRFRPTMDRKTEKREGTVTVCNE